jgi:hypothetical protein
MMTSNIIPSRISIDGKTHSFTNIFLKLSKTKYGNTLKSNIRFSEFKPKNISNEKWIELLGKDVSNLYHLYVSLIITKEFITNCKDPIENGNETVLPEALFSDQEQKYLLFTSVTHDWAEAIIGDIPLTSKKESDEDKEMTILGELYHQILGKGEKSEELEHLAFEVKTILTDRSTKLGKAFNAIERIGYLKTAMRSWYVSKRIDDETAKKRTERLAVRVVTIHHPKLFEYATLYPAVLNYLQYRRRPLADIFDIIKLENEKAFENWLIFKNTTLLIK